MEKGDNKLDHQLSKDDVVGCDRYDHELEKGLLKALFNFRSALVWGQNIIILFTSD